MPDVLHLEELVIRVGPRTLVDRVSLSVSAGELAGLVGASGSGKTLTCRSLLGLVDLAPGVISAQLRVPAPEGIVRPYDAILGAAAPRRARDRAFSRVRGRLVGYLAQNAPAALDPLRQVGYQVRSAAALAAREARRPRPSRAEAVPWLVRAGFDPPEARRIDRLYPHQLSGGMAQRVAIAQVLARGSAFLVADEPMTGLDATIQQRLVRVLRTLADDGLGVLVVTHDLGLIGGIADRIHLMDAGRLVESWSREELASGTPSTLAGQRLVDAARRGAW
ncbi:MAG TPA: ABC transporter ATP-binding protein [Deltaproteobacteria bacterium]|nr:ABC transporter ATP-binding protein [Deltaproteobacteria bacterium]